MIPSTKFTMPQKLALFLCLLCAAERVQPVLAQQPSSPASSPTVITLDEAIARARTNQPEFAAAAAASGVANLDRTIARSALLPSATYHNQYIYTQPNGLTNQAGPTGTQSAPDRKSVV